MTIGSFDASEEICSANGGCRYLYELSKLERLTGSSTVADALEEIVARCRRAGCTATVPGKESVTTPTSSFTQFPRVSKPRDRRNSIIERRGSEPIVFSRSRGCDIVTDDRGNYVERRPLKLGTLPAPDDSLDFLYRYWRDLRAASACQFSNMNAVCFARAGVVGTLHVVDVSSSDPCDFRYELMGYGIPLPYMERPRAHPIAIYADTIMRDYQTVRMTEVPRLHRVRARLSDVAHHYTRLILPFEDNRLAVAVRRGVGDGLKLDP
jgi:hypothetical protein